VQIGLALDWFQTRKRRFGRVDAAKTRTWKKKKSNLRRKILS
jgi:hypothetical protein